MGGSVLCMCAHVRINDGIYQNINNGGKLCMVYLRSIFAIFASLSFPIWKHLYFFHKAKINEKEGHNVQAIKSLKTKMFSGKKKKEIPLACLQSQRSNPQMCSLASRTLPEFTWVFSTSSCEAWPTSVVTNTNTCNTHAHMWRQGKLGDHSYVGRFASYRSSVQIGQN